MSDQTAEEGAVVKRYYLILLVLTIGLTACGNVSTMSSTSEIVSGIYTAAARTQTAQMQVFMPTSTPLTVATITPTLVPTLISTTAALTLIPPTVAPNWVQPTNASMPNYTSGFSQGSNAPVQVDQSVCDKSVFIDDITIPDGDILEPGEPFVKTWMVRNIGSCIWKADYKLKFFDGNSMSGKDTAIEKNIASGRQIKISVSLIAPDVEGTYTGYWILADRDGTPFGAPFFVKINVAKSE
jgi:hypothetical protein